MDKTFYILDSPTMPTGYNHMFFVEKVARGFEYNGFKVKVASRISEIIEPGFVMLCDHPFYYSFGSRHNKTGNTLRMIPGMIERLDKRLRFVARMSKALRYRALKDLARQIKGKDIVVIAWGANPERFILDELNIPVIFTCNYYYGEPEARNQLVWYKFYSDRKNENAMPIRHSADVDPEMIGKDCSNKKYLVSYIGDKSYGSEYRALFAGRPDCKIIGTPPYIPEEARKYIYKNSMFVLGLSSPQNKLDKIVTERVFEALAFGAICITDNIYAVKATDGCAILAKDAKELDNIVNTLRNDTAKREAIRQNGFELIRKSGTFASRATEFIELAQKLYSVKFA